MNGGHALVGGAQHVGRLGDDANQVERQQALNVVQRQHVALCRPGGLVARDQQVLPDRLSRLQRTRGGFAEQADDAVGVAHAGDFGVGDHHRHVGVVHGHARAVFNASGRVTHDVVEAHGAQLDQDLVHPTRGEGVLVAGLAGSEHEQVVTVFVLDQGLVQMGVALDDVDQVVHHAALTAHGEVEVSEPDVEVDDHRFVPEQGQTGGQAGTGGGFSHAPFARGDDDDLGHGSSVFSFRR